jgi:tetratricopeptide (TPR) repeat protein
MRRILALLAVMLLASCSASRSPRSLPMTAEQGAQVREAAELQAKGSYISLKRAAGIYSELSTHPGLGRTLSEGWARTCLMLSVREKDLGIINSGTLARADALIAGNPALAGLKPLSDVAHWLWPKSRGVMGDVQIELPYDGQKEFDKSLKAAVTLAGTDPLAAYLVASYRCNNPYQDIGLEITDLIKRHPDFLPLRFVKGSCSPEDPVVLQDIIARDPSFQEVYYCLGNASLARGNLLEAEDNFLKAAEAVPESPQVWVSLASISFAAEEFDRSIDFYDRTLALMPDFREAILGKAISLTYLGRNTDAMILLRQLVSLGKWLIGESNFWLAWNQHDLGDDAAALENIEQAKSRLGNGEVFSLAGLISLDLGNEEGARTSFFEALKFNPGNTDALFHLGLIFARRQVWDKSGEYYEKAAAVYEAQARALKEKADEVKGSPLPEGRKAKLLQRKAAQMEKTLLTAATAFYDAAAGYLNAGAPAKALACALKASVHPALKEKAGALVQKIGSHPLTLGS